MTEAMHWQPVNEVPSLQPGEIHLWWQDLGAAYLDHEYLATLLNDRERRRVARWQVDRVKREFTAARGVLKVLLSSYLNQPPGGLGFRYGPLGKPSIPAGVDSDELCFNYTDTGGFALYAFAWNRDLGIDLELLSRQGFFDRIIERRFAAREAAALQALPEAERRRSFLACWTRKEGYGKALGVGIRFQFDCIELCEDCRATPLSVRDHIEGKGWQIHQLYPTAEFVGALVHPEGSIARRCFELRSMRGVDIRG